MKDDERARSLKDEIVRDRMETFDQIAAQLGKPLSGKMRAKVQRQSEEMARRIASGDMMHNSEKYWRR